MPVRAVGKVGRHDVLGVFERSFGNIVGSDQRRAACATTDGGEALSTAGAVRAAAPGVSLTASRVLSIDIFRGLTIAVMIFVNELAEVRGLPWWTYHAHGNQDAMTYVDMVFPFFLFIVGMSMPLSIEQRLKRNPSIMRLWLHVIVRSLTLLVLGLILANAEKADAARMGMKGTVWALAALIGAGLYLNVYPKSETSRRYVSI